MKTARSKPVHQLVRKKFLNNKEVDNILMLDVDNWDIDKLEEVALNQRMQKSAISLNF